MSSYLYFSNNLRHKRPYIGLCDEFLFQLMVTVCDNKKSWKVLKPLLSHKIMSNEKITLFQEKSVNKKPKIFKKIKKLLRFRIISFSLL